MNAFENIIYNLVKKNPSLKNKVRNIYQVMMSVFPVATVSSSYKIANRQGYYFGYHDKNPFSPDDKLLLAHRYVGNANKLASASVHMEIGCFLGDDYTQFKPLNTTYAWNWTQGSMLQWLGFTDHIVFNDYENGEHCSRIINTDGKLLDILPLPVGAINPNGNMALSYNFARLRKGMPGYGYATGEDPDENTDVPSRKGSGLHITNISKKEDTELFTVADIANIEPEPSMKEAFHYFTHCLFSPSGKRFVFFHRWLVNNNIRYTRMISSDLLGNNLYIFPTFEMVSHVAWKDENHILAYARTKQCGDKYYLFEDKIGVYEVIGEHCFKSDGHPQFSPDGKYILTDTYPDRFGRQHLMLYEMETGECEQVAVLKQPLKYIRGTRCDFHPRWNRKGNIICFDSAHTGSRSLCTIKLNERD